MHTLFYLHNPSFSICQNVFLLSWNQIIYKELKFYIFILHLQYLLDHVNVLGIEPFKQPMNFMENLILMTFAFSLRANMDKITKYAQLHLLFQTSFLNIENKIMF